jgi:hypothetical protein
MLRRGICNECSEPALFWVDESVTPYEYRAFCQVCADEYNDEYFGDEDDE